MIHAAPPMIAKGSFCLFHDDKGLAELADINDVFFQKLEIKVCNFALSG